MKKKVRRGLKEEDPGSASETDSAMEDSSSGEESKSDDDEHLDVSNNLSNAKEIIETLSVEGGNETPLKWLKKCFDDEKEEVDTGESDEGGGGDGKDKAGRVHEGH